MQLFIRYSRCQQVSAGSCDEPLTRQDESVHRRAKEIQTKITKRHRFSQMTNGAQPAAQQQVPVSLCSVYTEMNKRKLLHVLM